MKQMSMGDYHTTKSTCTECLKPYQYQYIVLDQLSANEDTLYCPHCHKPIRYSRWVRYGQAKALDK